MQRRGVALILGLFLLPIWIALLIISVPVDIIHYVLESLVEMLNSVTSNLRSWVEDGER